MQVLDSQHDDHLSPDNAVDGIDGQTGDTTGRSRNRFTRGHRLLVGLVVVLAMLAAIVWYAINEAQKIPPFYAEVLATDMAEAEVEGKQFERNLVRLQNSARMNRPWMVEITQEQINGWFASDMREKFPDSVPPEVIDPRVVFVQQEMKLAFKYAGNGISGVVVIRGDVFCTETPNEIAFEVKDVRAGIVPLPIAPWVDKVADGIRRAGIPLYWSSAGESQVGVFTIPENLSNRGDDRQVVIEAVDLRPGKLVIAGKTEKIPKELPREDGQTKPADAATPPENKPDAPVSAAPDGQSDGSTPSGMKLNSDR